jgi:hypothetical protein
MDYIQEIILVQSDSHTLQDTSSLQPVLAPLQAYSMENRFWNPHIGAVHAVGHCHSSGHSRCSRTLYGPVTYTLSDYRIDICTKNDLS